MSYKKRRKPEDLAAVGHAIEQAKDRPKRGKVGAVPGERKVTDYVATLRIPLETAEHLKMHATMRRTFFSVLVSDVLASWVRGVTDERSEFVREYRKQIMPHGMSLPQTPERYSGYIASLGFIVDDEDAAAPADAPPPRYQDELGSVQGPRPGESTAEYQRRAWAEVNAKHKPPDLPPPAPPRIDRTSGTAYGNAAQRLSMQTLDVPEGEQ